MQMGCSGVQSAFPGTKLCDVVADAGTVSAAPIVCKDANTLCPSWKAAGDCNGVAADYTRSQCPQSCGICGGGNGTASLISGGRLHSTDSGMCIVVSHGMGVRCRWVSGMQSCSVVATS